jgi:hypothetical protein
MVTTLASPRSTLAFTDTKSSAAQACYVRLGADKLLRGRLLFTHCFQLETDTDSMRSMGGRLLNTTSRPLPIWCAVNWNPLTVRHTVSAVMKRICGHSGFAGGRCARYDLPERRLGDRSKTAPMAVNHALDRSDASDRFTWSPHWRRHGQRWRSPTLRALRRKLVTFVLARTNCCVVDCCSLTAFNSKPIPIQCGRWVAVC